MSHYTPARSWKSYVLSITLFFMLISQVFSLQLQSKSIKNNTKLNNSHIANIFGCEGKNEAPDLTWKNAPKETRSYAITMYDPDAPTGSGWWHWIVYNIPKNVTEIEYNSTNLGKMKATIARNDFGFHDFGGACPPIGQKHSYIFTLYALNINKIPVPSNASAAMIGFYIQANKIAESQIVTYFQR